MDRFWSDLQLPWFCDIQTGLLYIAKKIGWKLKFVSPKNHFTSHCFHFPFNHFYVKKFKCACYSLIWKKVVIYVAEWFGSTCWMTTDKNAFFRYLIRHYLKVSLVKWWIGTLNCIFGCLKSAKNGFLRRQVE